MSSDSVSVEIEVTGAEQAISSIEDFVKALEGVESVANIDLSALTDSFDTINQAGSETIKVLEDVAKAAEGLESGFSTGASGAGELASAVEDANSSLKDGQSTVEDYNSGLEKGQTTLDGFNSSLQDGQSTLDSFNTTAATTATNIDTVNTSATTGTTSLTELATATSEEATATETLNQSLTPLGSLIQETATNTDSLNTSTTTATGSIQEFGAGFDTLQSSVQAGNTVLGEASTNIETLSGAFAGAGTEATTFNTSMDTLFTSVSTANGSLTEATTLTENLALAQGEAEAASTTLGASTTSLVGNITALGGTIGTGVSLIFRMQDAQLRLDKANISAARSVETARKANVSFLDLLKSAPSNITGITQALGQYQKALADLKALQDQGITTGAAYEAANKALQAAITELRAEFASGGGDVQKFDAALNRASLTTEQSEVRTRNAERAQRQFNMTMLDAPFAVAGFVGTVIQSIGTLKNMGTTLGSVANILTGAFGTSITTTTKNLGILALAVVAINEALTLPARIGTLAELGGAKQTGDLEKQLELMKKVRAEEEGTVAGMILGGFHDQQIKDLEEEVAAKKNSDAMNKILAGSSKMLTGTIGGEHPQYQILNKSLRDANGTMIGTTQVARNLGTGVEYAAGEFQVLGDGTIKLNETARQARLGLDAESKSVQGLTDPFNSTNAATQGLTANNAALSTSSLETAGALSLAAGTAAQGKFQYMTLEQAMADGVVTAAEHQAIMDGEKQALQESANQAALTGGAYQEIMAATQGAAAGTVTWTQAENDNLAIMKAQQPITEERLAAFRQENEELNKSLMAYGAYNAAQGLTLEQKRNLLAAFDETIGPVMAEQKALEGSAMMWEIMNQSMIDNTIQMTASNAAMKLQQSAIMNTKAAQLQLAAAWSEGIDKGIAFAESALSAQAALTGYRQALSFAISGNIEYADALGLSTGQLERYLNFNNLVVEAQEGIIESLAKTVDELVINQTAWDTMSQAQLDNLAGLLKYRQELISLQQPFADTTENLFEIAQAYLDGQQAANDFALGIRTSAAETEGYRTRLIQLIGDFSEFPSLLEKSTENLEAFATAQHGAGQAAVDAGQQLLDAYGEVFPAATSLLDSLVDAFHKSGKEQKEALTSAWEGLGEDVNRMVGDDVKVAFENVADGIADLQEGVDAFQISAFVGEIDAGREALLSMVDEAITELPDSWSGMFDEMTQIAKTGTPQMIQEMMEAIKTGTDPAAIEQQLQRIIAKFEEAGGEAAQRFADRVSKGLAGFDPAAGGSLGASFGERLAELKSAGKDEDAFIKAQRDKEDKAKKEAAVTPTLDTTTIMGQWQMLMNTLKTSGTAQGAIIGAALGTSMGTAMATGATSITASFVTVMTTLRTSAMQHGTIIGTALGTAMATSMATGATSITAGFVTVMTTLKTSAMQHGVLIGTALGTAMGTAMATGATSITASWVTIMTTLNTSAMQWGTIIGTSLGTGMGTAMATGATSITASWVTVMTTLNTSAMQWGTIIGTSLGTAIGMSMTTGGLSITAAWVTLMTTLNTSALAWGPIIGASLFLGLTTAFLTQQISVLTQWQFLMTTLNTSALAWGPIIGTSLFIGLTQQFLTQQVSVLTQWQFLMTTLNTSALAWGPIIGTSLFTGLTTGFTTAQPTLMASWVTVMTTLNTSALQWGTTIATSFTTNFTTVFNPFVTTLGTQVGVITSYFNVTIPEAVNAGAAAFTAAVNTMSTSALTLRNNVQQAATDIGTSFAEITDAGNQMAADVTNAMNETSTAALTLRNNIQQLSDDFGSAMDEMTDKVESFADAFASAMDTLISSAEEARSAVEELQSAIDNLKDKTVTVTVQYKEVGKPAGVQHGGSFIVSRPTTLAGVKMGEHHKPELVTVMPLTNPNRNSEKTIDASRFMSTPTTTTTGMQRGGRFITAPAGGDTEPLFRSLIAEVRQMRMNFRDMKIMSTTVLDSQVIDQRIQQRRVRRTENFG